MLPEMTLAVARALALAQHLASQRGAPELSAVDVFQALVMDEDGRPAGLLREQGVGREFLGQLVTEAGAGKRPLPQDLPPPTAQGLAGTLAFAARRIAYEHCGESIVASEHLLLAVLQHDESLRELLTREGLRLEQLEAGLRPEPIALDEPLTLLESSEQIDAARILDANANRAREALRTLEDYCRFVLDDATLSAELKRLRHDLAQVLSPVGLDVLLQARETQHDVGVSLTTPSEGQRGSPRAVAQAAAKRLQEALRVLEEYGKLYNLDVSRGLEALRYRAYTLERSLLLGAAARQRLADARLYLLVSGRGCSASVEWTIKEAVAGGVQVIQLREKQLGDRELLARARNVRRWTREAGALFIMNDRPDLARLSEADGVHVGQEELSVKDARRILGPDALIGVSTHDAEQLRQAILDGADYVGVGPIFPSTTKNFPAFAGLEFVRHAAQATSLPAFAIGGITLGNVDRVLAAGLRRIAVGQAICQAEDPRGTAAAFRRLLG